MSEILVHASGLQKIYKKGKAEIPVLRGVDLEIRKGERIAIRGSSGAGKSTLLHILGTLETPTAGSVQFSAEPGKPPLDLFRLPERALSEFRNRMLGFVFQFHYLLPEFSALENVMMPALIAGFERSAAETQAKDLLKFVGMDHRLDHRPSELSGGEQQRVAIARAVILRPKLLLADELTGNLDSANADKVIDLLIQLNEKMGVTLVLVTHDGALADKMQRVISLKDGQILH